MLVNGGVKQLSYCFEIKQVQILSLSLDSILNGSMSKLNVTFVVPGSRVQEIGKLTAEQWLQA